MKWKQDGQTYWVKLDRGEEVGASLQQFLEETGIKTGTILAVGALQETELGFLDTRSAQYLRKTFPEEMELVNFVGNITSDGGSPFLHAHAVISGSDYVARGGHFFRGVVAVTFEAQVFANQERVERKLDEVTGLKLIKL